MGNNLKNNIVHKRMRCEKSDFSHRILVGIGKMFLRFWLSLPPHTYSLVVNDTALPSMRMFFACFFVYTIGLYLGFSETRVIESGD